MIRGGAVKFKIQSDEQAEQYKKMNKALRDGDYRLLLQMVPEPKNEVGPCLCRMAGCQQEKDTVLAGDFMLSLERVYDKNGVLSRMPKRPAHKLVRSPKGPRGDRGLGLRGQEWFCLECVEKLWDRNEIGERDKTTGYDPRYHALFAVANWIFGDERTCNDYPGCFSLHKAYVYGLEFWKAAKLDMQFKLDGDDFYLCCPRTAQVRPLNLFVGDDGESRYLDEEIRDMDFFFPNGASIRSLLKVTDVRGKWLRQVLAFVKDIIARGGEVEPEPNMSSYYNIGGARRSELTQAELAIMNRPDNESRARVRPLGASRTSNSAADRAVLAANSRSPTAKSRPTHCLPTDQPALDTRSANTLPDSSAVLVTASALTPTTTGALTSHKAPTTERPSRQPTSVSSPSLTATATATTAAPKPAPTPTDNAPSQRSRHPANAPVPATTQPSGPHARHPASTSPPASIPIRTASTPPSSPTPLVAAPATAPAPAAIQPRDPLAPHPASAAPPASVPIQTASLPPSSPTPHAAAPTISRQKRKRGTGGIPPSQTATSSAKDDELLFDVDAEDPHPEKGSKKRRRNKGRRNKRKRKDPHEL